jgi:hypothetical protein
VHFSDVEISYSFTRFALHHPLKKEAPLKISTLVKPLLTAAISDASIINANVNGKKAE